MGVEACKAEDEARGCREAPQRVLNSSSLGVGGAEGSANEQNASELRHVGECAPRVREPTLRRARRAARRRSRRRTRGRVSCVEELDPQSVERGQFRREAEKEERDEVEGEERRVRVVARVVGREEETAHDEARSSALLLRGGMAHGDQAHRKMGTEVSHFLAGVYCAPESICSHRVRLSKAPELLVMSKGTPVT